MPADDTPPTKPHETDGGRAERFGRVRAHLADLTPLRTSRDFRRLFIGRSISEFGDAIVGVAVPFQVYAITNSVLAVGLLGLCALVPVFVFPIVGGAFADALERRRLVIWSNAFLAAMSLLMALKRMPSSNALEAGFGTAVGMVGPVVAGSLLVLINPAGAFAFDVVTFLVAIVFVWRMTPSPPAHDAPEGVGALWWTGSGSCEATHDPVDLRDRSQRHDLRVPRCAVPGHGRSPQRGVRRWGAGPALRGAGGRGVARDRVLGTREARATPGPRDHGAVVVWGAAIVGFGLSTWLWLSLVMLALAGMGDMISGIFRMTILQSAVTDSMRGRLDGIAMAVWATGPALGEVESGVVASVSGSVPFSVVLGGALCVAGVGVLNLVVPSFARYDARDPQA